MKCLGKVLFLSLVSKPSAPCVASLISFTFSPCLQPSLSAPLLSSELLGFSPQEYLHYPHHLSQEAPACTLPGFDHWNPSHTHPKVSSVSEPDLQMARKGQGYKRRQKSCSIPCFCGLQQSHEGSRILAAHHQRVSEHELARNFGF